jgi:hypothetical protein
MRSYRPSPLWLSDQSLTQLAVSQSHPHRSIALDFVLAGEIVGTYEVRDQVLAGQLYAPRSGHL